MDLTKETFLQIQWSYFDETGTRRTSFVGPYREGATMTLICDAFGGIPPPSLTWSRDGQLIDNSYQILSNGTVRNEVSFRNLDRSFLHDEFSCIASNTNLTRPIVSIVHLDMNFPPTSVNITNKIQQFVVGKKSEVHCRSTGSRPPAQIVWYLNGQRLDGGSERASPDGNTTVGVLQFLPKMEDIGKELDYAPRVELVLGKSISLTSIYEGNNVQLNQNYTEGILLTNRSLVLQNIARRRSGGYTCQAINAVGRGSSQAIILDVKYIPVCKNKQPVVHGVGKSEMVDVICDIFINVPRVRAIKVNDTRSKLTYTPRTNKDYGTLMCSATNEVGTQKNPCIFHIILAVAPDPVENCTIINKSSETFHLHCVPGFDGGMEQLFLVTVTERSTSLVRYNATARQLDLFIPNLRAGSSYLTTVTPMNKKGYGKTTQVLVDTLNHPAVELTQAEGAYSSSSSSSSESISDTHLSEEKKKRHYEFLVSVTIRYCVYHQRNVSVLNTQSSTDARLIMPSNSNNNHGHFGSLDQDSVITAFPPNTSVRKGILKRGINNNERCSNHEGEWGEESPDLIPPPPPPLLGTTSSSAELLSNEFRGSEFPTKEIVVQGRASFITKGESCTLPRRTSKEGILHDSLSSEANNPLNNINTNPISNGGSTDPLLQIPDELCAVLTLQRSSSVNKARIKSFILQ
ncbi:unnamed protein product [Lepeophtheirus salmonis]|uniref:(salmon louse) hypothetical protein n=1 Tax=Lepeophtheirus salmonis TaxID=72036 RepID=A0A7R8CX60_LEPSM|nr:unnamed protein product [Lepeophtheirus salmonis]CAF2958479.1 unnamed protein product [Lepeophtheirus salmonis]